MNFSTFKKKIGNLPMVGPCLRKAWRVLHGKPATLPPAPFVREPLDPTAAPAHQQVRQCLNLINYAKAGGKPYSATKYPGGYHSMTIGSVRLAGQRDPEYRLNLAPFNFKGKTVLDIGSNQGGMLLPLGTCLRCGVGVDYDPKMVNVANRIAAVQGCGQLRYDVFDIDREPLELLKDFLPDERADIVFLLSICMWIKNWREVIAFAASIAPALLFESNGTPQQQSEQEQELRRRYARVQLLTGESVDDANQKLRKLFFCDQPVTT